MRTTVKLWGQASSQLAAQLSELAKLEGAAIVLIQGIEIKENGKANTQTKAGTKTQPEKFPESQEDSANNSMFSNYFSFVNN